MKEREYDDRTCMIISRLETNDVGFIVDTVSEVKTIYAKDIEPSPCFSSENTKHRYIAGIGKVADEVKILLDIGNILSSTELEAITEQAQ
jgi:purine-binding chemotaxis protein CheW